jgi:hypothetical protein
MWILAGEAYTNHGGGCLYIKTRCGVKCYSFSEKNLGNRKKIRGGTGLSVKNGLSGLGVFRNPAGEAYTNNGGGFLYI